MARMALLVQLRMTCLLVGPVSRKFQASRVGLKSIQGKYLGPWKTAMGCLIEVMISQ